MVFEVPSNPNYSTILCWYPQRFQVQGGEVPSAGVDFVSCLFLDTASVLGLKAQLPKDRLGTRKTHTTNFFGGHWIGLSFP